MPHCGPSPRDFTGLAVQFKKAIKDRKYEYNNATLYDFMSNTPFIVKTIHGKPSLNLHNPGILTVAVTRYFSINIGIFKGI